MIVDGRKLLEAVFNEIPPKVRFLADLVRIRTGNRFHAEVSAIARRAGVGWRDVLIANISYDLAVSWIGCSTAVIPTLDGPIVARNMDWWPEQKLAQTSYVLEARNRDDLLFANAGWPGSVGVVTGLSGRGFAIIVNAVGCAERAAFTGYPVLLHARRVLENASGFDDALLQLSQEKLFTSCLYTLVGSNNDQRVVIERTPRKSALRWAKPCEPLIATNHYRMIGNNPSGTENILQDTTCGRFDRFTSLLQQINPENIPDDDQLLWMLTDPDVVQNITAQHVIICPRKRTMNLFVPTHLLANSN